MHWHAGQVTSKRRRCEAADTIKRGQKQASSECSEADKFVQMHTPNSKRTKMVDKWSSDWLSCQVSTIALGSYSKNMLGSFFFSVVSLGRHIRSIENGPIEWVPGCSYNIGCGGTSS